jgi:RNA polymerase sigma-70 factor, ECF subfamily
VYVGLHGDGGDPRWRSSDTGSTRTAEIGAALVAARAGDGAAIESVYAALHPRLLRYLRHHIGGAAPDVASEVWLSLAKELPRFGGGPQAFRALMFTIARRRVVDHHRWSSRQPAQVPLDASFDRPDADDAEARVVDGLAAQDAVRMLTDALPADQAEIVLLRVLGDLDVAEVASIVGKSPGAVRIAQYRAIRRLQKRWQRSAVTR